MADPSKARLFGQQHSSRDYTKPKYWGKNQFNSSFPASLIAYMSHCDICPVYLCIDKNSKVIHQHISGTELFGIAPLSDNAYYNFEAGFSTYEKFYEGKREAIDLVMVHRETNENIRAFEIKLTALPDATTRYLSEDKYCCEIVVRPPTICFLACSICEYYKNEQGRNKLLRILQCVPQINHWEEVEEVARHYNSIEHAVLDVCHDMYMHQVPLVIQPVWKTIGENGRLADDCLDVFVWSNLSMILLCVQNGDEKNSSQRISRLQRTIVWVYKMLMDYAVYGKFDYVRIVKNHSYEFANDKAFSIPGTRLYSFLRSEELSHPRIKKQEIKHIILGGGQHLLSPERRFDAAIVNSDDLFDE